MEKLLKRVTETAQMPGQRRSEVDGLIQAGARPSARDDGTAQGRRRGRTTSVVCCGSAPFGEWSAPWMTCRCRMSDGSIR